MTITFDNLINCLVGGKGDQKFFMKYSAVVEGQCWTSCWRMIGTPGAGSAPSTNEAPTRSTQGALYMENPTGGDKAYFSKVSLIAGGSSGSFISTQHMLVDRLSHSAGLSGTVATAQTTNLPTAALTRYTTGEGVWIGLHCWTATGSTAANVTCSYTNQAGTSGRTSTSVVFWTGGLGAGTVSPTANQIQVLPFQTGDTGCRSVESVTLSTSTLTAGNFGVVLFKPLLLFNGYFEMKDYLLNPPDFVEKVDNAALDIFFVQATTITKDYLVGIETVEIQ